MSDGLTVPFALAAGLTGAISQTQLVVTAGFAEIAAGSIVMVRGKKWQHGMATFCKPFTKVTIRYFNQRLSGVNTP